jgi:hypothetical protein
LLARSTAHADKSINNDAPVDIFHLVSVLRQCPALTLTWKQPEKLHRLNKDHRDVEKDISSCIDTASSWTEDQLDDIASAKLDMVHYTDYLPVLNRRFVLRMQLKKGITAVWWNDEALRFKKTRELLVGLGFDVPEHYVWNGWCVFYSLRIEVEREGGGVESDGALFYPVVSFYVTKRAGTRLWIPLRGRYTGNCEKDPKNYCLIGCYFCA